MVKVRAAEVARIAGKLPEGVRAVLVFGKDEGLIREHRDRIARQIAADPADPFSVSAPEAERIAEDPALLADEMGAVSMTGGRRLVRIDGATDRLATAVENALSHNTGDALLLVVGGDLSPRSALRKLFEQGKDILALPCYADTASGVAALVRETFRENRIEPAPGVIEYLTARLGGDRLVTRAELEKLVLFAGAGRDPGGPQPLSLEDVKRLVGDASELTLGRVAAAATGTEPGRLVRLLDRAREQGIGPIEILRTLQFRLQQMHLVRGLMDAGTPLGEALSRLRPPLFFKDRDLFAEQVKSWSGAQLKSALDYTLKVEAACKTTGAPDFSLAEKACLDLTRRAGPSRN